jgi:hypothetical protein
MMRLIVIVLVCAIPLLSPSSQTLASKVIRIPLNQNEPAVVKLGTHGITTLEFPYKIEALDGYGFSNSPAPDGPDLFQISFNKGTNFLSLKALHEGVEGNLTVVLDGKVYCLFCTEVADPSFVMVFEDNSAKMIANPGDFPAKSREVSPARLLGFLDKIKGYPSLKVSAPEIFRNMGVAEPNSESSIDGLKVTLRRVIRDENLDALGFEVELINQAGKDFFYDPESFAARIGDEVYPAAISDAAGVVEAGKVLPAFFVVAGTATGGRNDLAVSNKFDIVMRQIVEGRDLKHSAGPQEPLETVPEAVRLGSPEPPLPAAESGQKTRQLTVASRRASGKSHRGKRVSLASEENSRSTMADGEENDKTADQADE